MDRRQFLTAGIAAFGATALVGVNPTPVESKRLYLHPEPLAQECEDQIRAVYKKYPICKENWQKIPIEFRRLGFAVLPADHSGRLGYVVYKAFIDNVDVTWAKSGSFEHPHYYEICSNPEIQFKDLA